MKHLALCCLSLFACAGCPPTPSPAPGVPDAAVTASDASPAVLDAFMPPSSDASTQAAAICSNLRALGCPEGKPECETAVDRSISGRLTRVDVPCLSAAKTKAAARACGYVTCP